MPRNSSGACTLAEPAFVAATPIRSAVMNSDLDDIASMMTDSLSRSGSGGMQTTLSLTASGFVYATDPDTGMSRSAANTQIITVGGEDYTFTATDMTAPSGLSLLPLVGEIRMWALPTAPTGWMFMRGQAATLADNPLWRAALIAAGSPYGTSGADPRFPNMQCMVPAGLDVDGRGLLTGSTVLGDTFGEQAITLTEGQMPSHDHAGTTGNGGVDHTHPNNLATPATTAAGRDGAAAFDAWAGTSGFANVGTASAFVHTHPFTTDAAGSSQAHANVQPTIVLNYIGRDA